MLSRFTILFAAILGLSACSVVEPIIHHCKMPKDCAPVSENYKSALQDESPLGWSTSGIKPKTEEKKEEESFNRPWVKKSQSAAEKRKVGRFHVPVTVKKPASSGPTPDQKMVVNVETPKDQAPLYIPGKPFRVWAPHWVSSDGVLHSGQYVYLQTPAYYNYFGRYYKAGSAQNQNSGGIFDQPAILHPTKPSQLGFVPKEREDNTNSKKKKEENIDTFNGIVLPEGS